MRSSRRTASSNRTARSARSWLRPDRRLCRARARWRRRRRVGRQLIDERLGEAEFVDEHALLLVAVDLALEHGSMSVDFDAFAGAGADQRLATDQPRVDLEIESAPGARR